MATLEEYEKRLHISYLDEADPFGVDDLHIKSMVSISALKGTYVKFLETDWKALRVNYGVPSGVYLHFSKIKNLLNSNTASHDAIMKSIFSKSDGSVDYGRIYSFYNDVLGIITRNDFIIQATGICSKKGLLYDVVKTNSIAYQLFEEHIDRMAHYLVKRSIDEYKKKKSDLITAGNLPNSGVVNNLKLHYYFTKLRYDGSYILTERNDYRDAFSHCISSGTRHFNDELIKEVFDTLSFVSKEEVGLCTTCTSPCSHEFISHAGDEIVDFIALYVARDMWKSFYRDYCINTLHKAQRDVDARISKLISIDVPGCNSINPMNTFSKKVYVDDMCKKYACLYDYI